MEIVYFDTTEETGTTTRRSFVDQLFTHTGKIEGVVVVRGGAGFSRVRGAVAVANALAYAKGIPIASIEAREGEKLSERKRRGALELTRSSKTMLVPEYNGEPNITKPPLSS